MHNKLDQSQVYPQIQWSPFRATNPLGDDMHPGDMVVFIPWWVHTSELVSQPGHIILWDVSRQNTGGHVGHLEANNTIISCGGHIPHAEAPQSNLQTLSSPPPFAILIIPVMQDKVWYWKITLTVWSKMYHSGIKSIEILRPCQIPISVVSLRSQRQKLTSCPVHLLTKNIYFHHSILMSYSSSVVRGPETTHPNSCMVLLVYPGATSI